MNQHVFEGRPSSDSHNSYYKPTLIFNYLFTKTKSINDLAQKIKCARRIKSSVFTLKESNSCI